MLSPPSPHNFGSWGCAFVLQIFDVDLTEFLHLHPNGRTREPSPMFIRAARECSHTSAQICIIFFYFILACSPVE